MSERHAHEVMEMMVRSGKRYNRESLAAEIRETFGAATTFYTCSAEGLAAEELIEFLAAKGKFFGTEDSFVFDTGMMCQGH
ncbi:MAG: YecH family metal-binding protein [Puniceicoccaceae bacterium]